MFDIQYLMSEWHDKSAILPSGLKHVLKQGMKILGVSVNSKWDRLVTYWLAFVATKKNLDFRFQRDAFDFVINMPAGRPRWLSWMRRPTVD